MAKQSSSLSQSLLDSIRPAEADGPLQSVILATYGLSLEQPNFFEQDFLPTLLGLGGVRDRGYTAPVTLERKLAESYCALICDAHALAQGGRPSLRIDVISVAKPRHHAKVVCIHRQRLVRLIVASANLTHTGYRSQREVAAVLDFRPEGSLPGEILDDAVARWLEILGESATVPLRNALETAVSAAREWSPRKRFQGKPSVRVVFGGPGRALLQDVVAAWPDNERLLSWRICSPFWPSPDVKTTPFDAIAKGLGEKGTDMTEASIELVCSADSPGDRARPVFPFPVLKGLRLRGFPITRGRIVPARLETLADEVPERKAEGHRPLHAKWMMLRGPKTTVALLGSANFTNPGLGVNPQFANIEAGVLIVGATSDLPEDGWLPPLVDQGSIDWATCANDQIAAPLAEPDDFLEWPNHIRRIDLAIHWESGSAPQGTLKIELVEAEFCPTIVSCPDGPSSPQPAVLLKLDYYPTTNDGRTEVPVDHPTVSQLLARRAIPIMWGDPPREARFPINILEESKAGLPSLLGARPDEQQLLAYFHGRIGEDDLLLALEQRATAANQGSVTDQQSPSVELQNYLIREFVESLYGLQDVLAAAMISPRALEQALLGEFSPASLGERILHAFRTGYRSATAFQLTELLRVVSGLTIPSSVSTVDRDNLVGIKERAMDWILSLVRTAGSHPSFLDACRNSHFVSFVRSSLSKDLASRFLAITASDTSEPSPPVTARLCDGDEL